MEDDSVYWFRRKKTTYFVPKNAKGWAYALTFVVLVTLILFHLEENGDSKSVILAVTLVLALLGILFQVMKDKSRKSEE